MGLTKQTLQQWFKMQRTLYGKLTKDGVSGEGAKQRSECQEWTLEKLHFMGTQITRQAKTRQPASIKLKLAQMKASAMVRRELMSISSSDEEGRLGLLVVVMSSMPHLLRPSMAHILPRRRRSKLLLMSSRKCSHNNRPLETSSLR